nr:uncharacterized protein LOC112913262 [Vulpes vulpes]
MPPSAPLLSDSIQLVRDSRSRRPPGGDPQPWGPASTAGGHPGSSLALSTRWLLEAGVAHSWGPSHTPRPWGQASRGCQTPRGTRALGALGPRTTSLSPPGIRWDGISANPASAEGRAAGKDQDGGEAPRGQLDPTPRPQRSGAWRAIWEENAACAQVRGGDGSATAATLLRPGLRCPRASLPGRHGGGKPASPAGRESRHLGGVPGGGGLGPGREGLAFIPARQGPESRPHGPGPLDSSPGFYCGSSLAGAEDLAWAGKDRPGRRSPESLGQRLPRCTSPDRAPRLRSRDPDPPGGKGGAGKAEAAGSRRGARPGSAPRGPRPGELRPPAFRSLASRAQAPDQTGKEEAKPGSFPCAAGNRKWTAAQPLPTAAFSLRQGAGKLPHAAALRRTETGRNPLPSAPTAAQPLPTAAFSLRQGAGKLPHAAALRRTETGRNGHARWQPGSGSPLAAWQRLRIQQSRGG